MITLRTYNIVGRGEETGLEISPTIDLANLSMLPSKVRFGILHTNLVQRREVNVS